MISLAYLKLFFDKNETNSSEFKSSIFKENIVITHIVFSKKQVEITSTAGVRSVKNAPQFYLSHETFSIMGIILHFSYSEVFSERHRTHLWQTRNHLLINRTYHKFVTCENFAFLRIATSSSHNATYIPRIFNIIHM